eukprot:203085_1
MRHTKRCAYDRRGSCETEREKHGRTPPYAYLHPQKPQQNQPKQTQPFQEQQAQKARRQSRQARTTSKEQPLRRDGLGSMQRYAVAWDVRYQRRTPRPNQVYASREYRSTRQLWLSAVVSGLHRRTRTRRLLFLVAGQ